MTHSGFVVINKPAGVTSHDVVARVRRVLDQKRVGHAGTLDPDATGVLVIGVGAATRLMQFVSGANKVYVATLEFGAETSTYDASGEVVNRGSTVVARDVVNKIVASFVGPQKQIPPMVSAISVGGEKLYKKARRGEIVERAERDIVIQSLVVDECREQDPTQVVLRADVSAGTYIRSLAHDIGIAAGTFAHLVELRRVASGMFDLSMAAKLEDFERDPEGFLLSPARGVSALPVLDLTEEETKDLRHGKFLDIHRSDKDLVAGLDPAGNLVAIVCRTETGLKPQVVINP